jgi:hypothetical protein
MAYRSHFTVFCRLVAFQAKIQARRAVLIAENGAPLKHANIGFFGTGIADPSVGKRVRRDISKKITDPSIPNTGFFSRQMLVQRFAGRTPAALCIF